MKRYFFNTSVEIAVGDLIKSPNYESCMRVVEVLEDSFKYFNRITGNFTNSITSSEEFPIRELVEQSAENIIYFTKIK